MNETNESIPESPLEDQTAQMSTMQRIIGIFNAPGKTVADVAANPTWVVPFIIVIVISMALTHLMREAIIADHKSSPAYENLMENDRMTIEQIEQARDMQISGMRKFAWVGAGATTAIAMVFSTVVLLFVGNIILGGSAKFRQIFSLFCWAGLIGLVGYLLRLPMALDKLTMKIYFSPAVLFPAEAEETALFKIAAALDIFVIWRIVIIALGFAAIYRFSAGKSFATVGGLYTLLVLGGVVFSSLL
jgi:hypothetical protein